ncbi:MAG: hypothetical protein DRI26_00780 [Chloroflexi bacterium]|nr:MAG: hypothetical protein DRI26_00780 [Chloroflexota bacterium]
MKFCERCGARFEDGGVCPKCGSTILRSDAASEPVRRVHSFFSLAVFYAKAGMPVILDGEPKEFPIEWRLLLARPQQHAPPILIWERDGLVSPGRPEAALSQVDPADIAKIIEGLPVEKLKELRKILDDEWGLAPTDSGLHETLRGLLFQSVPRLRDVEALRGLDWRGYVARLACWKPGKDPRLTLIHEAKLLEPMAMKYAPHSIEVLNAGTGKSIFYDVSGILVAKATRRSVLGYARSPNEVYPGTINGTKLPTAFDQIESQDSYELARYMFQILETGRALVDAGGFRFPVETGSSFAYLGNPIAKNARVLEGFQALLDHISSNPAIGRRFGIILFNTSLKTITGSDKLSVREEEEWKAAFTLFRAVEEYVRPKLKTLIRDARVVKWLHTPIPGYRETIINGLKKIEDYNLKAFFEAHIEGEHRVRGAALHAATALLLDKIALDEAGVEELLAEAEELLGDYIDINLGSIANLAAMWTVMRTDQAMTYFQNASDYMKEIISAVLHWKRGGDPDAVKIALDAIPYQPQDQKTYKYFSRCISRLKKRKRLDVLNERLRDYYGFQFIRKDDVIEVEYLKNPAPPEDLPLIGFIRLSDLSIYPPQETGGSQDGDEEEKKGGAPEENPVSKKGDKRIKRINGYGDEKGKPSAESFLAALRGAGQVGEFWPRDWLTSRGYSREEANALIEGLRVSGRIKQKPSGEWMAA